MSGKYIITLSPALADANYIVNVNNVVEAGPTKPHPPTYYIWNGIKEAFVPEGSQNDISFSVWTRELYQISLGNDWLIAYIDCSFDFQVVYW